jgi:NtrC-family two-component system sensor histidine kinase KinB
VADPVERNLVGELIALVTHDLRNPLAALQSNIDFMRTSGGEMSADFREALDDGIISCDALGHVIANLEIISRTLKGRVVDREVIGLEVTAAAVVDSVRKVAEARGLSLTVVVEESGRDVDVRSNGESFGRALANLLHNAIQFSPSRGEVRVVVRGEVDRGVVRVEDGGATFAASTRASVFTAEGQVAAKSDGDGRYSRGLGLLCASLAAVAAGAEVATSPRADGTGNAFELSAPRI